jgi:YVTN family beta-propeller protein
VGLENADVMVAIDTLTNKVIAAVPIGQAPQAVVYVPDAVPKGAGLENLSPLGVAGQSAHLRLAPAGSDPGTAPTSVSLFDQGLVQVLEASVTGLAPRAPYVLALAGNPDGSGPLQVLSEFKTNPAGGAIVNSIGPIRQIVESSNASEKRYLVIAEGSAVEHGVIAQTQTDTH